MLYKDQIIQGVNDSNLGKCVNETTKNVNTTVKTFNQYVTITRAANTTAYAAGQLISGSATNSAGTTTNSTVLAQIDLTPDGAVANQRILLTQLSILSNQNPATSVLVPIIQLFSNALSGLTDAQAFTPDFSTLSLYKQAYVQSELLNTVNSGTNAYCITADNMQKLITLDEDGAFYIAVVANNAYVPKSGELIKIRAEGLIL